MIIRVQPLGTDFVGLFVLRAKGRFWFSPRIGAKLSELGEPFKTGESFLGLFYAGNEHGIVGPDDEMGATALDTKYTALGNLITANDKGAVISPLLTDFKEKIEEVLGVSAVTTTVAGLKLTGSLVLANNNGACVHPEASPDEMNTISDALGVPTDYATICKSGFVGAMAVASDKTMVMPSSIMAPEMAQVLEVLDIE